jgi:hypothetical protein
MAKHIGMSANMVIMLGRIIGKPVVSGGWVQATLRVVVPEPQEGGGWNEVEMDIPIMSNNPKTVETFNKYIDDERQLWVNGYIKTWVTDNVPGFGVVVTTVKLGAKTMYDDTNQGGQGGGSNLPPLPS